MTENKALKCIEEIEKVISKWGFEFPKSNKVLSVKKSVDAKKAVEAVFRILKNHDEKNAEVKLKQAVSYLSGVVEYLK